MNEEIHNLVEENFIPEDEILSRIFAVHAIDSFPKNGIIYPAAMLPEPLERVISWRPTIHWALGGVVPDHGEFDWSNRKYAIITPLSEIMSQLVNVNPYDTFSLGSVHLNDSMAILAPQTSRQQIDENNQNIFFYPSEFNLNQAVTSYIMRRKGFVSHFTRNTADVYSPVVAYDGNIKCSSFNSIHQFRALLEKRSFLSYGSHIDSIKGWACKFGIVDQLFQSVEEIHEDDSRPITFSYGIGRCKLALINLHLSELSRLVNESGLSVQSKQDFDVSIVRAWKYYHVLNNSNVSSAYSDKKPTLSADDVLNYAYIFSGMSKVERNEFSATNSELFEKAAIILLNNLKV